MTVSTIGGDASLLSPTLETKVNFLSRPDSYAEHPSQVETVETHMSWVFLTDCFVYKLKKPVRFSFLDFSTLAARHRTCREEIRLNRRMAEDVYLGLVRLTIDNQGRLALDGDGNIVEWLVKMKRLPKERMLDNAIRAKRINVSDIRKFTNKLAKFYCDAPPVSITQAQYRERFQRQIRDDHERLLNYVGELSADQLNRIARAQLNLVNTLPELLDRRVSDKRIIEAHGDLRPEHICLAEDPVFIDCLEFNQELRILDPVLELAYLVMECELAGADWIGHIVFDTYRHATGDDPPVSLIHFYKAYRATTRAKLAIWHIEDRDVGEHRTWINKANAYLQLAEKYCDML
jgi:aminoglycoside phosphotransferase family enzyme